MDLKWMYDATLQNYLLISDKHRKSQIQNVKLPEGIDYQPLIDALMEAMEQVKLLQELDLVKLWDAKMADFIKNQFSGESGVIINDEPYYF
jgi:hypothetical protein